MCHPLPIEILTRLCGAGAIPSIGLIEGGKISQIKIEHVWVEAWVDYIPSRGAVNREDRFCRFCRAIVVLLPKKTAKYRPPRRICNHHDST
jgi:hypothetical protein